MNKVKRRSKAVNNLEKKADFNRVFRLGPECYIIYLGSNKDDEKPFIRIGNVRKFPEALHKLTSRVVLTSSCTGNPFLEVEYAKRNRLSYLGDVEVIAHFKKFFQGLNLPSDNLNDYSQLRPSRDARHTLYFYNNGNIHLNFDDTLIFDLHRREREDSHSNQKCDKVKSLLLKNPLRYTREELNKSGFFISEQGSCYLFHNTWIALEPDEHYFMSLASQGIDPDEVGTLFTHSLEQEMPFSHKEALVQLIKRRSLRDKSLLILTTSLGITDHLQHLFPEKGEAQAICPVFMEEGQVFDHGGISAEVKEQVLNLHWGGKHDILVPFGAGEGRSLREGWRILQGRGVLTYRAKNGMETRLKPLKGFPLIFAQALSLNGSAGNQYLTFLHPYLEAWKGRSFWAELYELEDQVKAALGGASLEGLARDSFSISEAQTPGLEYIFLHNCITLLEQKGVNPAFLAPLRNLLDKMEKPDPVLPVLGDLCMGKKGPFLLYRISSNTLTPHNYQRALEIAGKIGEFKAWDSYREERNRLQKLLDLLYGDNPKDPSFPRKDIPRQKLQNSRKKREKPKLSPPKAPPREESYPSKGKNQMAAVHQTPLARKKLPSGSFPWKRLILFLLIFLLLGLGGLWLWKSGQAGSGDSPGNRNLPKVVQYKNPPGDSRQEKTAQKEQSQVSSLPDSRVQSQNVQGESSRESHAQGGTQGQDTHPQDSGPQGGISYHRDMKDGNAQNAQKAQRARKAGNAGNAGNAQNAGNAGKEKTRNRNRLGVKNLPLNSAGDASGQQKKAPNNKPQSGHVQENPGQGDKDETGRVKESPGGNTSPHDSIPGQGISSRRPRENSTRSGSLQNRDGQSRNQSRNKERATPRDNSGQDNSGQDRAGKKERAVRVETERRPVTREEALAYLEIEGIQITLADIHLVANAIAVKNGFHDLDYRVFEGENPDWIYSGNLLIMPDGQACTVNPGDSIWYIASRLIRRGLERDLETLASCKQVLADTNASEAEKAASFKTLEALSRNTSSSGLRKRIELLLKSGVE